MKRIAVWISPTLVLALLALWLMLNQTLAPGQVVLGLLLAVALTAASASLRPVKVRLRRLDLACLLVLVVLRDIVQSNYNVARIVLGGARERRSAFVRIPLDLRDPHGLAALSMIITATPGTIWAGVSEAGDALTLHVLDLRDEAGLIAQIKDRYELPLRRIFE